jgi:hypothetical protein
MSEENNDEDMNKNQNQTPNKTGGTPNKQGNVGQESDTGGKVRE